MATFLQLCADVAEETGGAGRAPTSVVGQSGRQALIVRWVRNAWEDWQNERTDWRFLKGTWDGTLVAHTAAYTGASFSIDRFRMFIGDRRGYRPTRLYDPDIGVSDQMKLSQVTWPRYRDSYELGAQIEQRPTEYCIDPAGAIRFGCTPDKGYVVGGEYVKTPQTLSLDADVPDLPAHLHRAIIVRAALLMAIHDEAGPAIELWQGRTREWRMTLLAEQLEPVDVRADGPLA